MKGNCTIVEGSILKWLRQAKFLRSNLLKDVNWKTRSSFAVEARRRVLYGENFVGKIHIIHAYMHTYI